MRTIPVLGTTPAVFGMAAAAHIMCALAGAPLATEPLIRLQAEQYAVQRERLAEREELLYGSADGVAVDIDDVSCMPMRPVKSIVYGVLPPLLLVFQCEQCEPSLSPVRPVCCASILAAPVDSGTP